MEKISVIMPVYNSGDYLSAAVQSILNQTYNNFELLIVDDGSEQDVEEILQNIPDKRIKFFKRNHEGIAAQRNFALSQAKGKYIANMDSDDISHPNRFQEQIEFISKHKADVVGTNFYRIDENDKILYHKKLPEKHREIEFIIPIMLTLLHPSILIYRKALEDIGGYNVKCPYAEDYELYLRLLRKGYKMYNIQKPLLYYRIWVGSTTEKFNAILQSVVISFGNKYFDEKMNFANCKSDRASLYYQRGIFEYYHGDLNKSRLFFLKSTINNPSIIIKIIRYVPLLLLWNKLIYYLRRENILYRISIFLNKNFNLDFFKVSK